MKFEIFPSEEPTISMVATGDIYPAKLQESNTLPRAVDVIYDDDVLSLLHAKDISFADLECPLTTAGEPSLKVGPNISAPPESIEALRAAKFDIAALANNHIMDYGDAGLQETLSICKKTGIRTVGVGSNFEAANEPLFVEVEKRRIAFLAFAEGEFSSASETMAGAAKLDPATAGTVIRKAKEQSDLVIVNVHGGSEFYPIPSPRTRNWYHLMVECGADAIIGHHPHTIQGIEIYRDVPIVYSLGNFIFPTEGARPRCWHEGLIAKLLIAGSKVCGFELFPCKQVISGDNVRIKLLKGEGRDCFARRFNRLTQIASDPNLVREFWKCFCFYKKKWYINSLKVCAASLPGDWLYLLKYSLVNRDVSYIADIMRFFQRKSTKCRLELLLWNLLICPAHHEVLSTIVEIERLEIEPEPEIWDEFESLMVYCKQ